MRDVDFDICWFLYVEYFINVFFMMELIVCLVCCFLLVCYFCGYLNLVDIIVFVVSFG